MPTRADLRREPRPGRVGYEAYLHSAAWRAKRLAAIAAAGGRCQVCNSPNGLEAHHRTYARFGREEPGDLTILCDTCHRLVHGRLGVSDGVRERSRRLRARIDATWERMLERSVGDLQAALGEAMHRLSVLHEFGGRASWELDFARRTDAKVRQRIMRTQDRIRALTTLRDEGSKRSK